ncbi:MAG: SAM-dependent DNA methyltransferase, partial [Clostridiaceae bacterium]|nr:SAM-dependent DNA methyltransferase [Clostridiaceae bacterium]
PNNIRLYPGFEYDNQKSEKERALAVTEDANEILDILSAKAIDSGSIWKKQEVSTEQRVDRHLLANLKKLSKILTGEGYELRPSDAHTLIGKYIYLKYLRDRGILSDERLEEAGVSEELVYSQAAQKEKLYNLEIFLDGFLNGSVFPLPPKNRINTKHIQKVAGVFKGDDPQSGQPVLFDLYDFSYVPIETLSVVYQQFLHQEGKGRSKGAYYTPVHLVNFILDELDSKRPLEKGMKVFDPACGSGAFLVQCYRRLIERIVRKEGRLKPTELRSLLENHIFGLDADEEACRVAELSLSLTLLDYIEPKDLSTYPTFRLPGLHNTNIFHCEGGFFDKDSKWSRVKPKTGYSWIVGNPPWKNKYDSMKRYDRKALDWINSNKDLYSVGNQQLAEAFAWKISDLLAEDGLCGLLMPALSLFTKNSGKFRRKFFSTIETSCIVNFSNLRHILFEGADNPAAAFFFSGQKDWDKADHYITTYAPFAVEQFFQLKQARRCKKIWSVGVNSSAIREISLKEVQDGSSLPWKMAMWGTHRDSLFLSSVLKRYPNLITYTDKNKIDMHQGPEFRALPIDADTKRLKIFYKNHDYCPEYIGKQYVDVDEIPEKCLIIPDTAYHAFKEHEVYLRKRGGRAGLKVCANPHILVSASRKFSVYSDKPFMIPPRQIGLAGSDTKQLKALALYLNSPFIAYEQWLTSAAWGIERDRPNFNDLKKLPIPFSAMTNKEISILAELYDVIASVEMRDHHKNSKTPLFDAVPDMSSASLKTLLRRMNETVCRLLGITKKQHWLIEDMLNVRIKLNEGKIAKEAIKPASRTEIFDFTNIFQGELDLFLDHTGTKKVHKISVFYTERSAVLIVEHLACSKPTTPEVIEVKDNKTRQEFDNLQNKLTSQKSQWIYFTRCLRIPEKRRTYIFKPRQRLYWLKSQALVEADEFIAEKVGAADD